VAWSTRELAELAGTTVNTVRHYHRVGLLAEPERRGNGYKQYGARKLVQLLRIRRLTELGVPLSDIERLAGDDESTLDVLRNLDAELAQQQDRITAARTAIATILTEKAPPDIPAGFESLGARLSAADRSLMHVYTRLYDEKAMADVRQMMEAESAEVSDAFTALPADADDETRQRLAESLGREIAQNLADYPWLTDQGPHRAQSEAVTQQAFLESIVELYNEAQRDVLVRASVIANELRGADAAEA